MARFLRPLVLSIMLAPLMQGCTEYEMVPDQEDPTNPWVDTGRDPVEEVLPVAVCDVTPNPVAPPFESATWLGEDSYDPTGGVLVDYRWTLTEKPDGSAVLMPEGEANRRSFVPDLAGDYEGQLVVINNAGLVSKPCYTVLESIPVQDFWIEMYWAEPHDDMDLHLLAPGGSMESNTDCYYSNCVSRGLDWGVRNNVADDPSLDIDDIPGVGPENINIHIPQNGVFTVWVHDYENSGGFTHFRGANNVTVNVYLGGNLAFTTTKPISGEGDYTKFAEVDWANGTVQGF